MKFTIGLIVGFSISFIAIKGEVIKTNKNGFKVNIKQAKKIISKAINKRR